MNSKYIKKTNYLKSFIKFNSLTGNESNTFKYFKNNSFIHEFVKFRVFIELINRDYEVFTEVDFKDGGRADIVFFDFNGEGHIIEIINSEKKESVDNKINSYPLDFDFIPIFCNKQIDEQLIF